MILNAHFACIAVNSEASKRLELERSWQASVGELRSHFDQERVRVALKQQMSLICPSSTAQPAASSSCATSSCSQGLLNRLERVASASRQLQRQTSCRQVMAACESSTGRKQQQQPMTDHERKGGSGVTKQSLLDEEEGCEQGIVPRKKFNKVHSMRMMVSGSPEQQAARQLHQAEKQLQTFINAPQPKLPK